MNSKIKAQLTSAELLSKFSSIPLRITTKNRDGEAISFEIFANSNGEIIINHTGENLQRGENDQIAIAFKAWWIGLHWFIKSEHKKHVVPRKGVKKPKVYEPYGLYLKRIFILCEGCQSRKTFLNFTWELPNVIEWFCLIWKEIVGEHISYVLNQDKNGIQKILEIHNASSPDRNLKRGYIRNVLLPAVAIAENYENPYENESFSNEEWLTSGYFHRAMLLESSIKLADQLSEFNAEYYQPFLKAWHNLILINESSDYSLIEIKEGDLHEHKGKSTTNLSQYIRAKRLYT